MARIRQVVPIPEVILVADPTFCLQLLVFGQSGANGPSATPLVSMARSSDFETVMRSRLLPAMATQLRPLHVHQVTENETSSFGKKL